MLSIWKTQIAATSLKEYKSVDVGKIYYYERICLEERKANVFWLFSYFANGINPTEKKEYSQKLVASKKDVKGHGQIHGHVKRYPGQFLTFSMQVREQPYKDTRLFPFFEGLISLNAEVVGPKFLEEGRLIRKSLGHFR